MFNNTDRVLLEEILRNNSVTDTLCQIERALRNIGQEDKAKLFRELLFKFLIDSIGDMKYGILDGVTAEGGQGKCTGQMTMNAIQGMRTPLL